MVTVNLYGNAKYWKIRTMSLYKFAQRESVQDVVWDGKAKTRT